jgi:hypothetical protein
LGSYVRRCCKLWILHNSTVEHFFHESRNLDCSVSNSCESQGCLLSNFCGCYHRHLFYRRFPHLLHTCSVEKGSYGFVVQAMYVLSLSLRFLLSCVLLLLCCVWGETCCFQTFTFKFCLFS